MTRHMRIPVILGCAMFTVSHAHAESLSAADREALLEKLESLREAAVARVDARFRLAIAAYREAITSEDKAMDFYLKCTEKVNFDDKQKKNAEFREWKHNEADRHSAPGFRVALIYQLRWLILTLQASSEKANLDALAPDAQEIVDSIFRDAAKLASQENLLGQPVNSTIFAKAYEIGNVGKDKWPLSPVNLEEIYSGIVFPPLRSASGVEKLRAAWIKRIKQEEIKVESWSGGGGKKGNLGPPSPELEKFRTETLPEFQWQMEMDLFRSGDESAAAKRMIAHITTNITHRSARKWGEELEKLLKPIAATPPTATSSTTPK
jgi:hypothetical protein